MNKCYEGNVENKTLLERLERSVAELKTRCEMNDLFVDRLIRMATLVLLAKCLGIEVLKVFH
jgi:hypothetical protein